MPTHIIKPDSTISNAWTVQGAATAHDAVNDTANQPSIPDTADMIKTSASTGVSCSFTMENPSIPSNEVVTDIRVYAYCKGVKGDSITMRLTRGGTITSYSASLTSTVAWRSASTNIDVDQVDLDSIEVVCVAAKATGTREVYAIQIDITTEVVVAGNPMRMVI